MLGVKDFSFVYTAEGIPLLSKAFDREKEQELLAESVGGVAILKNETGVKILDTIKKYLEKRYVLPDFGSPIQKDDEETRRSRLSFFKADCAVLFRFFTQRIVKDFLSSEKFEKLSIEDRASLFKREKIKLGFRCL